MDVALWIAAGFLALSFAGAGYLKLTKPMSELATNGLDFVEDFDARTVRAIGTLEILAAAALVVPALVGFLESLVPIAALGLMLLMVGAITVHVRRGETRQTSLALSLLLLAGFVAFGRFGPQPF